MSVPVLPEPAPPTGDRFAVVTPDDNAAPLIIVTILSLVFSFFVFGIRILVVKWRRSSVDDWTLALAHIVAVGHWTCVFIALENGLGKALDLVGIAQQDRTAKVVFASRPLLMITLCLSKISILLVTRTIFHSQGKRKIWLIDAGLLVVSAWGIAAALALSVECSPDSVLGDGQGHCVNHVLRLQTVLIIDAITELGIVALPVIFLWNTDIVWKTKSLVITAFSFRLPLVLFSIMYLTTHTHFIRTFSTGTGIVPTILWQETLLGYSLISATIPCLKNFIEGFTTGGAATITERSSRSHTYFVNSQESSTGMSWLSKKKTRKDSEATILGLGSSHQELGGIFEMRDLDARRQDSTATHEASYLDLDDTEGASLKSKASQQMFFSAC